MRSVALLLLFAALPQAATRKVTVLVNFEKPHSTVSVAALRQELNELMAQSGLSVDLLLKSDLPSSPEFAELVIFQMKGSCSMDPTPLPIGALSDERGPLAMAYLSDGQILHFGEVECDRVRRCLQRISGRGSPEKHQAAYGAALGMIMAHEIYHMIAGAKIHTKVGLTKESLSARELLDGALSIPSAVRESLQRSLTSYK